MMLRVMFLAAALVAAAGCGGGEPRVVPEESKEKTALTELGQLLPALGRPASSAKDFAAYRDTHPLAVGAVNAGKIVVVWGASLPGEGDAGKGTTDVVAYEKDAATAGGYVLQHNGTVVKMSAAEFAAAKKAK